METKKRMVWVRDRWIVGSTYDVRELLIAAAEVTELRIRWDSNVRGWECQDRNAADLILSVAAERFPDSHIALKRGRKPQEQPKSGLFPRHQNTTPTIQYGPSRIVRRG